MNRIRLLSDQVANQIAAGEVVERPASVVKELVENSLDADACRISVEIGAGGRSLIRVTDDGFGMSRDDALLSLERHATSKIRRAEDLASIVTMGFRGEAVPSIASVSRFTLITRERNSETPEGTQVVVNGGTIAEVKAAAGAPGTSVEVRQLFFNLPARRKFLRTEETEAAHIQHYLTLAALAHPDVSFLFIKDGRSVWQLPAIGCDATPSSRIGALRERLRALMGEEQLLPVHFIRQMADDFPMPDENDIFETALPEKPVDAAINLPGQLRLWGLIGAPGISRTTRDGQFVFVNRRPVENRGINYALIEGYHNSLMKGRYPVCCLFLEIHPSAVDVNVHPSKREVKFRRESEVRKLVADAIQDTLLSYHAQRPGPGGMNQGLFSTPGTSKGFDAASAPEQQVLLPGPGLGAAPLSKLETLPVDSDKPSIRQSAERAQASPQPSPTAPMAAISSSSGKQAASPAGETSLPQLAAGQASGKRIGTNSQGTNPHTAGVTPLLNVPLRLIGVVGRLYVLLESDRGLVLLDQHAAHERVLFEQMRTRLEQQGTVASQKLLLPETLELPPRDAQFLREQLAALTRLGVGLSEFGERTFLLDSLPPFVRTTDPRKFVLDLVDELRAAGREVNLTRLGEHTVAKTVCRHAVKANDHLAGAELENLIADLRHCAMPYTCPHGRPTLVEMNYRELEKKFGRTL